MISAKSSYSSVMFRRSILVPAIFAGTVAAALAAAVTLAAAGLGWLVRSHVLAGALAMIASAILVFGFGGMHGWAIVVVGLSWGFADKLLGALGVTGSASHFTMA